MNLLSNCVRLGGSIVKLCKVRWTYSLWGAVVKLVRELESQSKETWFEFSSN